MDMLVITRGCCWSFLQVVWSLILHHGGIARLKPMSRSGFDEPWWGTEFRILGNERWTLDWSLLDDYWIITGWLLDHYWMIIGWWWWGWWWWWLWLFFLLLFLFIPHYDGDDDDNYYCPHILPKCWIHFSCHSLLVQVCPRRHPRCVRIHRVGKRARSWPHGRRSWRQRRCVFLGQVGFCGNFWGLR